METINDRIAILIDKLNISKTDFANKLKVTQPYISTLVKKGTPSDRLVDSICMNFDVNRTWLIDGTGEIFVNNAEEKTAYQIGKLLNVSNPTKQAVTTALIDLLSNIPDEAYEHFKEVYERAMDSIKDKDNQES